MTPAEATVRPAGVADLEAVAGIYAHYVDHTVATFAEVAPDVAEWEQRLADLTGRGLPFLVAELSGAVVGFAFTSPWRPKPAYRHTVEDTIYLAPGATGRGLGTALLREVVRGSARAG
ncbi:N-acetyltransferase family protein, partial [Actinosynnema sp. NPDC023658]|uniref:GNAT family N-acetyltransferase n=1 Tax=Actinosynnema sp. NPDC023658 TaxID=3155465 RepID=UPI0033C29334